MKDDFGDRMKQYESTGRGGVFDPALPLCVRIDGKGFSKFTSGFEKPYDDRIVNAMRDTAKKLAEATNANVSYVQSDEITLIFTCGSKQNEHIFGGKPTKINSLLASMATAFFNEALEIHDRGNIGKPSKLAFFDCRSWTVPDMVEASNVLLWRAQDCRRNSISAIFRWSEYGGSAKVMMNKSQADMIEYMKDRGYDWEADTQCHLKYGIYFRKELKKVMMSDAHYYSIPRFARPNSRYVERFVYDERSNFYFGDLPLDERIDFITKRVTAREVA